MIRTLATALVATLCLLGVGPDEVAGQIERPLVGAAVGAAGGGVVTLSVVVARARFQREYLDSADDLIHWQSIPMIAAPAAGILFGLAGEDSFEASVIGSISGMLLGAGIGTGIGWIASRTQEGPWAGGAIGAGIGLSIGGLFGGLRAWQRDEDPNIAFPTDLRVGFTVPIR